MAVLTETERAQIRKYLGWPARWRQQRPDLDLSMNAIDMASEDDRTELRLALAGCIDIDARLTDALLRNKASQVGSITLNPREIGYLRAEGRRHAARIASTLGIWIMSDAFSGAPINNAFSTTG